MPSTCAVPYCTSNTSKFREKVSTFGVPVDEKQLEKWSAAIPGKIVLKKSHRLCEKHFRKDQIRREWVCTDKDGRVISQVPLRHPILEKGAVPSIFPQPLEEHSHQLQSSIYHEHAYIQAIIPGINSIGHEQVYKTNEQSEINNESTVQMTDKIEIKGNEFSIKLFEENNARQSTDYNFSNSSDSLIFDKGIDCVVELTSETAIEAVNNFNKQTQLNVEETLNNTNLVMDVAAEIDQFNQNEEFSSTKKSAVTTVVFDSVSFDFNSMTDDSSEINNVKIDLMKPWNAGRAVIGNEECLILSYVVERLVSEKITHIMEKAMIIKKDRTITYEVCGYPCDVDCNKLPVVLNDIRMLPDILKKFKDYRICKGVKTFDFNFLTGPTKYFYSQPWRTDNCTLLSLNRERCPGCQKKTRTLTALNCKKKNTKKFQRISRLSHSVDQNKLRAMQKKLKHRARQTAILKKKVQLLENVVAQSKTSVANLPQDILNKIKPSERLVIEEIIAAAKKDDSRGRRYSEDYIMLCMLMNIRNSSYYNFLRDQGIMALPCKRTIRDYISLIKTKCGFDPEFFQLLEKSFRSKSEKDRHGILVIDEINVRKSIAVSSSTLTYTGLTDYGEDGPQSTNINDQASHGLVFMFQSLTKKDDSQPIAVFASKNSVPGEELSKLAVKAICLLEKAGAVIHGIIGDGASTNRKMWTMFDIDTSKENLKNWFVHPLNDKRKIFIFSDTPHLIKCIRNTLYSRRKLKVFPDGDYIKWEYMEKLHDLDIQNSANLRSTPKLTRRHVRLDNTGKMRVRLATQVFSKSVARGMEFYRNHHYKEMIGCEATVDFCLMIDSMFDALNRKHANEGLTPDSGDYKTLQNTLKWLDDWEQRVIDGKLMENDFLTKQTAHGLRVTIQSTMDLCNDLINNYGFSYLLTGRVNQDNLEKFFGTIRGACGSNTHPSCPTFLQVYKLLSVYSIIKPPKTGNCTITEGQHVDRIKLSDLKSIFSKPKSKTDELLANLKNRLDDLIKNSDLEVDEVMDHDYAHSEIVDVIVYYVTGSIKTF